MSISIHEIAKLSGVSTATVSRVINGSSRVSPATAAKVQEMIQQLNFVPDNRAIHLSRGKSQIYGIIIPDLTNPFFTETVKEFEALLFENEQEMLVANTDFHGTRLQRSVHRMLLRRVDGVAILTSELEAASLESLVQNRISVVTTDHYRTACGISDIAIDFGSGITQMVEHLKQLGHRNLGFIGGTEGLITSRVRRESFMDAVVKQGLSSRAGWIGVADFTIESGSQAMARILAEPEIPTAILCANDLTAIGALRTAYAKGLDVPGDISVAGCDDIDMADIVYPPLTTLRISRREYARLLYEALRDSGKDLTQSGRQLTLPLSLVVRKSTGPAPKQGGGSTEKRTLTRTRK
ncbi:LacI family DNA-binding transcriptional regulator [Telmatobacter bradus]|uniref:LacI family DNA-binding transcriptional regulator n=1 Tax=Telmatobacter bradus TaxID=474953 RepID=UPI003B42CBA3